MQRLIRFYIDIPALRPGTVGAYALAFVAAGVATALRLAIDPYVAGAQYITFFPAVMIMTLISGSVQVCSASLRRHSSCCHLTAQPNFCCFEKRPDTAQEDPTSRPSIATMLRLRADKRARRRAD
jgi:hypothetical protein